LASAPTPHIIGPGIANGVTSASVEYTPQEWSKPDLSLLGIGSFIADDNGRYRSITVIADRTEHPRSVVRTDVFPPLPQLAVDLQWLKNFGVTVLDVPGIYSPATRQ